MKRSRLTLLGLSVFALILVSFVIRGFGQLLLGPRTATLLAAPTFGAALALVVFVLAVWLLSLVGVTSIED